MKIIHVFYAQNTDGFFNDGQLHLWIETNQRLNMKGYYPYQLKANELSDWFQTNISLSKKTAITKANFPCNRSNDAIPSPLICNYCDIEDTNHKKIDSFSLNTIEIETPLHILKSLNFLKYYLDDDVSIADDAKFWILAAQELTNIIKYDQYTPLIVATKEKKTVKYFRKYHPLSSELDNKIQVLAKAMPISAYIGNMFSSNKEELMKHFNEYMLTQLIETTTYSKKLLNDAKDTTFAQMLESRVLDINESEYIKWQNWTNNLSHDLYGAPFNICFRLNSATDEGRNDWSLEILMQSKKDLSYNVPIGEYFTSKVKEKAFYHKMFGSSITKVLLLQLGLACRIYEKINTVFASNMTMSDIPLSTDEAYQFLKFDAWSLKAGGYKIIVPSWWSSKGRVKAKIKMKASKSSKSDSDNPNSYFDVNSLANFNYQLAMGAQEVTFQEWQTLLNSKSELVYFRGQWVEIDVAEMEKIQKLIEKQINDNSVGNIKDLLMASADQEIYDVELDDVMSDMLSKLNDKDQISLESQPTNLKAQLRPYQIRGLSWLGYLEDLGLNPCLADDMGLGKTMQVIALLLLKPKDKPALLVAPTSVVGNWLREINKFAPSIRPTIHHGATRNDGSCFKEYCDEFDIVITSYGLIRKDKKLFNDYNWSRLIIDEAQNIKNPLAAQTKVLYKIPSQSRIAITGTPVENRLLDLWSIFNFLNPGFLGTRSSFKNAFEFPIQRDNCPHKTKVLKKLVEPFILRRLKTDKNIIQDLPDKVEQKVYCELSQEQALIYQSIVDEITSEINETDDLKKRSVIMISSLLKLKQCCNHPAQVLQDNSDFTLERSVKLQRLVEMVKEISENGESILIFSQFTEICAQLNTMLKREYGMHTYYLHGGTSRTKRETMITEFQDEKSKPGVFILSLKAGGVGITLTKANHVIHFDRWWNPAVENQATDRAYRIGQKKTVFAYKYITMGTIEEKIDRMLEDKQRVADLVVGSDETWLSKLGTKSFIDLIKLSKVNSTTEDERYEIS